ncbi:MAG: Bcr/CflA family efflux MFS transporter [Rubrivivax sp.]
MTRARVAFALALLLGLQPVTTDLYLPALPQLTRELGAPMSLAQQTMAALILAFGLGQLAWGPIADRVGRRPVLLGGLSLYAAAALAAALAQDMSALVACRAAQGLGMASAVVCARALLRDLYDGAEGAQVMALGMSGLGLLAIGSPAIGGVVATLAGWRAALAGTAVVGAAALAFVALGVPETLRQRRPDATRPSVLLAAWARMARHRVFVAWSLLSAATYGGLFTMLAGSSFVYIEVLGLSPVLYGVLLGSGSLAYIAGTVICRYWVRDHGPAGAVQRAAAFTLAGAVGIALPAALGVQSVWAIALPQCLYAIGHGIHQPCGQSGVAGPFPREAGAASALAGFVLAAVAFGVGVWLGRALDGSVRPLAYGVGFWALVTCTVAWTLVRRLGPAGARP